MKRIVLKHLLYTGPDRVPEGLEFGDAEFLYGASNTGKSFALKSLNFMLGGEAKDLPRIKEREPYDRALLGLNLPTLGDVTFVRSTRGGNFEMYSGLHRQRPDYPPTSDLLAKHSDEQDASVSSLLLSEIGLANKKIAKNKSAQKNNLSFRYLVPYCLVNETSIQAEASPVSGARPDPVTDQSVFRLLLTGHDDSALAERLTPPQFKVSKTAKIETVDELLVDIEGRISTLKAELPDDDDRDLEAEMSVLQAAIDAAEQSVAQFIDEKSEVSQTIFGLEERFRDVTLHIERFRKLEDVYVSDIQRLEALEEAGFLINLVAERPCPLCGASPDHQHPSHGSAEIELARQAAVAEISKITSLRTDLKRTVDDLTDERRRIEGELKAATERANAIEASIRGLSPDIRAQQRVLSSLIAARDQRNRLTGLEQQRQNLTAKRAEFKSLKRPRSVGVDLSAPDTALHDFTQVVADILKQWRFPGENHVSFDHEAFDLKIDGKLRTDNGKGVRALTHAAFKIALLLYCQDRNLPHPGFLVLDSPLLTYRDPVRNRRHGALTADERALAQTEVKFHFIEHLATLKKRAQIIILDNTDPPANIGKFATPTLFAGSGAQGRLGFFRD